jgi:hypothetical protein
MSQDEVCRVAGGRKYIVQTFPAENQSFEGLRLTCHAGFYNITAKERSGNPLEGTCVLHEGQRAMF